MSYHSEFDSELQELYKLDERYTTQMDEIPPEPEENEVPPEIHPFIKKYKYLKSIGLDTFTAAKIAQWTVYADNVASHHAGIHIDSQLRAYEKMQD